MSTPKQYRPTGGPMFALVQVRHAIDELRIGVAGGALEPTLSSLLSRVATARAYLVDVEAALKEYAENLPHGHGVNRG